jgi:hypothetical protein
MEEAMKQLKVITSQVEGGQWQARFEGATDNTFGQGNTADEAQQNLLERSLQAKADMGNLSSPPAGTIGSSQKHGPTLSQQISAKVDRLVVKALPQPTLAGGVKATHYCYRESDPAVQAYGVDEQSARVAFLTQEQSRANKPH